MRTITVTTGPGNSVSFERPDPPAVEVYQTRYDSLLTDLRLIVNTSGQTRWNIGGAELRHHLFVNGIRATRNVDYTINLPYLDWVSSLALSPDDELILTLY